MARVVLVLGAVGVLVFWFGALWWWAIAGMSAPVGQACTWTGLAFLFAAGIAFAAMADGP